MTTLVDTGAQVTFVSVQAARRAGILHLMDTRYAGYAKGVGGIPTQVLGRIPANTVLLSFATTTNNPLKNFQASPSILILSSSSFSNSSPTPPTKNRYRNNRNRLQQKDLTLENNSNDNE